MLDTCSRRQMSALRRAASIAVESALLALGLFLLLPVLAGGIGLDSGFRADAAPAFHAGGPDAFGYTFKDSNEPGGPVYAWEEIATSGVLVTNWTSYDDGYAGPIPIGFTFNYYGTDFSQLYIGSNGYLSFGQGYGSIPGGTPPQTGNPNNDIALFGGDMFLCGYGSVSAVHYQTLSNPTRLVVQFSNLYTCCSQNTPRTFQAILYPSGDIVAQYRLLNGTSTSYAGIENGAGNDGLGYGVALNDTRAIRYTYPRGIYLLPASQTRFGAPGTVVRYPAQIINRTGHADSFDIALQPGHAWPATVSITRTGMVSDGASIFLAAEVVIPSTAAPGDLDQAVIRVSSVTTPSLNSTAAIHTQATSGEIAYVTMSGSDLVALVDIGRHTVLATVNVGASGCDYPWHATIAPNGHQVYVSCYYSNNVVVIDTNSTLVSATVAGIATPGQIAFTRDDVYALIGSVEYNQIAVVHTKDYTVRTITTPNATTGIAAHPYLDLAYATSASGEILVIDTSTFTIRATVAGLSNPSAVAVSPDGRWVYATGRYGAGLVVMNTENNAIHTVVSGMGELVSVEVAPDGSKVYVGELPNSVRVIDAANFQAIAAITDTGSAWTLEATCDGAEVWVGNTTSQVLVIDAPSNLIAQSMPMPGSNVYRSALCRQHAAEGAFLIPLTQSGAGAPGSSVAHHVTLVNATQAADSFTLALSGGAWPAALSTSTIGPLGPGQTATFTVSVAIPVGVPWYAQDAAQVTAVGVNDPTASVAAGVNTIAESPPVISVTPTALSSVQTANQTVDQVLTIRNGNGVTLTVELSDMDVTPRMVRLAPLDLPAAADVFGSSSAAAGGDGPDRTTPPAARDVARVLAAGTEPSPQVQAGGAYTTTFDNEDNALTGVPDYDMDTSICDGNSNEPVEFNIFVDGQPGPRDNALTVLAYDVDWPDEHDTVRMNGVQLGYLAGNDDTWSETTFDLPANLAVRGANLVQIELGSGWCATVDWGELFVTGGPAGWLDETPAVAAIAPNSSQDIVVTFDSNGLQPGEYLGEIILHSNDPEHTWLSVPVSMTAEPAADMGRIHGAVSDAWAHTPLTATVVLEGVLTMTAHPAYEAWAVAGAYTLTVSASGYATATVPVTITPGEVTIQDVGLEPALPRLEWLPQVVTASVPAGERVQQTLLISNTGPAPLDIALFEIDLFQNRLTPRPEDLAGKRILFDRAHGEPAGSTYGTLLADAVAAGAVMEENWYFPIEASVLQGYDILWINCCGSLSWSYSELQVVSNWLQLGGSVLVQGENSPATTGPASIFGIYYVSGSCASGPTSAITPHPVTSDVRIVNVDSTCWRLASGVGSDILVRDSAGQPHVVVRQHSGGKMVVLASEDLADNMIRRDDNRLLGNNILSWLARPAYTDVPWLSISPITATLSGHSSLAVAVQFDAAALEEGAYQAMLAVEHNDAAQAFPVELPVNLAVLPPRDKLQYLPLILVE